MTAIYDLLTEVTSRGNLPSEWYDKMVHKVPDAPSLDRADYLIKAARGKSILDFGGTGPMADKLREVAADYRSLDKLPSDKAWHYQIDLDTMTDPPLNTSYAELIIAGEVIEHLSNPGNFLDVIARYALPVILTTPNATARIYDPARKAEIVNGEHVAWYSYHTLKTLVERHGFRVLAWFWYNGKAYTAEGLIFHMEPINGTS